MEFHQIRYFLAACDHMNFTRAAESCAVSQPALTVAIQKLEAELGGPLFLRDAGRISLTDLGRTMRTHLARIEETRAAAGRAAEALLEDRATRLDVGIYSTIGPCTIAPAIAEFQAAEPEVEIVLYDIWGSKAFDILLSGGIDLAIVASHGPVPAKIRLMPLMDEPMVLALPANHALVGQKVRLGDLAGLTYFDRLRCEFRDDIRARMRQQGVAPSTVLRSEPEDWVQHAIADGRGVTIAPRDGIVTPGIATAVIEDLDVKRTISVATVEGRALSPAAAALHRFLSAKDWSRRG